MLGGWAIPAGYPGVFLFVNFVNVFIKIVQLCLSVYDYYKYESEVGFSLLKFLFAFPTELEVLGEGQYTTEKMSRVDIITMIIKVKLQFAVIVVFSYNLVLS